MSTIDEIVDSGDLDGYKPGEPSPEAAAIDAGAATASPCIHCGSAMSYEPYVRHVAGTRVIASYRAFAVCTNRKCRHAVEF